MIGTTGLIWNTVWRDQRFHAISIQNTDFPKTIHQRRTQQHLIVHMPEVISRLRGGEIVSRRRSIGSISEMPPHRIIKETVGPAAYIALLPTCQTLRHHRMESLRSNDARIERIHVQVANQYGAIIELFSLRPSNIIRQGSGFQRLIIAIPIHPTREMDSSQEDSGVSADLQMAYCQSAYWIVKQICG